MTIIKRGFDKPTTLLASDAAKAANASRRSGLLASSLAGVVWLALCLVALGIYSNKIDSVFAYSKPLVYISYKEYALIKIESKKQHKCLCILWGKESAWNPKAVGNLTGKNQVYGIPQGSDYVKLPNGNYQLITPCMGYYDYLVKGFDTNQKLQNTIKAIGVAAGNSGKLN